MRGKDRIYQILTRYLPGSDSVYRMVKQKIDRFEKWFGRKDRKSWFLGKTPKEAAKQLSGYDVVSFDVFDTLIFRPFSEPAELFQCVADRIQIPEFRKIRCEMERKARQIQNRKEGNMEVTLDEIYALIERETGIKKEGKEIELLEEYRVCYANPYMKQVVEELRKMEKRLIFISDMYLNSSQIFQILAYAGYSGFDRGYVSSEYRKSKSSGELYRIVHDREGKTCSIAHVGDNEVADVVQAKRYGLDAYYYKQEL